MKQSCITMFTSAIVLATVGAASAQVEIGNGKIIVRSPDGKTTRITNGGVQTGSGSVVRAGGTVSVTGNGAHRTIAANGRVIEVAGNSNHLTVTGYCPRLLVSGNSNQVVARNVAVIDATGNQNRIRWQQSPTRNGRPAISRLGNRNTVQRL